MVAAFFRKLSIVFADKALRNRILVVLGILCIFRLLNAIPVPGVNPLALQQFVQGSQLVGFFNLFSGGGLSSLSILMLGVVPFITASIILQLLTLMFPRLKEIYHEEGEAGRRKFNQYSRLLAVLIAVIQGVGILSLLAQQGVLVPAGVLGMVMNIMIVVAGAMLAMWLGELMSEFGIGNGVSIIIFAGIVSSLPSVIAQAIFAYDPSQLLTYIGFVILGFLIVAGVVMVTEAERPIPITYAKQGRGGMMVGGTSTYIPLRINQAGVMPIIFASSILFLVRLGAQALVPVSVPWLSSVGTSVTNAFASPWLYAVIFFVLSFVFTYFYTAVTFDADSMAENLQKSGAFVPGTRPGASTAEYVAKVLGRVTFFGALFLSILAVLPLIFTNATGSQTFAIGGTALLIVVGTVLDLVKKLNAQASMREY